MHTNINQPLRYIMQIFILKVQRLYPDIGYQACRRDKVVINYYIHIIFIHSCHSFIHIHVY